MVSCFLLSAILAASAAASAPAAPAAPAGAPAPAGTPAPAAAAAPASRPEAAKAIPAAGADWAARWRPLLGEWVGSGGGSPGQGEGGFSFGLELQGKAIVRRNHADYPASASRPASTHEDLMVISPGGAAGTGGSESAAGAGVSDRATYWDSEGHMISYTATWSLDGKSVTFLSDPAPGSPRYRLSYHLDSEAAVSIRFDIAPPPTPDQFKPYITAKATRLKGK
jgi:hypothetical protein